MFGEAFGWVKEKLGNIPRKVVYAAATGVLHIVAAANPQFGITPMVIDALGGLLIGTHAITDVAGVLALAYHNGQGMKYNQRPNRQQQRSSR